MIHVTTAHKADDVRIFERECRSLAASGSYDVYLAAAGSIPGDAGVTLIPLTPAPTSRAGRFTAGPRKAFALTAAVDADLWHFHDPELLPVALRLARSGHRVIWDAHEDYVGQFEGNGGKGWVPAPFRPLVRRGTASILSAVDAKAAGVVAATPKIASRYDNLNTTVVGNEARLEVFAGCRPDFDARRMLFTGHVGQGHMFEVVAEAVAALPSVELAVAGRTPDPVTWDRVSARLHGRIMHLGWLDRAGLAAAMNEASLGVLTYADAPANSENSPNKLFEFAAAGLPVIASPNPGIARLLAESGGGFIAAEFSVGAIKRAISSALSDRSAWEVASRRAREWAGGSGSWELSESRLLDLYRRVLGLSPEGSAD